MQKEQVIQLSRRSYGTKRAGSDTWGADARLITTSSAFVQLGFNVPKYEPNSFRWPQMRVLLDSTMCETQTSDH